MMNNTARKNDFQDICLSQKGDDQAFARLVENYQGLVFNLCYRMMGEPEIAEEAAQESFFRAYQNIHKYNHQFAFSTWLLSIATHYCIDLLRRRKLTCLSIEENEDDDESSLQFVDPGALNPELETEKHEEQNALRRMLLQLDSLDRAAIVLRYWYDFSEVEIASQLSLTTPAVKSRLFRARKELAKMHIAQQTTQNGRDGKSHYQRLVPAPQIPPL